MEIKLPHTIGIVISITIRTALQSFTFLSALNYFPVFYALPKQISALSKSHTTYFYKFVNMVNSHSTILQLGNKLAGNLFSVNYDYIFMQPQTEFLAIT